MGSGHEDAARSYGTRSPSQSSAVGPIRAAFNDFDEARNGLLPHLRELLVAPLLVTTAPAKRDLVPPVIDTYRALVTSTEQAYGTLTRHSGMTPATLVELLMLVDTVFLDNGDSLVGMLLTPLHPSLALALHRVRPRHPASRRAFWNHEIEPLSARVSTGGVPLFLASSGVPRLISETAPPSLPFSGKLGGLPHFSEQADARDPIDGFGPSGGSPKPTSPCIPRRQKGLRLALLEPPDAGAFLSHRAATSPISIRLRGAHVTVFRRGHTVGAELNLSTERNAGSSNVSAIT